MKKYFIHANCHALKSGFKHEFHETTYFKPTFCVHCAGLVSSKALIFNYFNIQPLLVNVLRCCAFSFI